MGEERIVFAKDLGEKGSGKAREFLRQPDVGTRWIVLGLGLVGLAAMIMSQFVK